MPSASTIHIGRLAGSISLESSAVELLTEDVTPSPLPMPQQPPRARPISATPITPVTSWDIRPAVSDLLLEHADSIQKMRSILEGEPMFVPQLHDDLFLLRFWLSHASKRNPAKSITRAADAARVTIKYRAHHGLDDVDIRHDWPNPQSRTPIYRKFFDCFRAGCLRHTIPNNDRGLVTFFQISGMDPKLMLAKLSEDEQRASAARFAEWSFQILDAATRRTGRLTKAARLIDFRGANFSAVLDRDLNKREATIAKAFEDHYPQVLGHVFIIDPPGWIQLVWRVLAPFFPKRFVEKVALVSTKKPDDVRRLLPYISAEDLPVRFGGENSSWEW